MAHMGNRISVRAIVTFLSVLILCGPLAGDAAAQPTIRFASSQYAEVEGWVDAPIKLQISGDVTDQVMAYIHVDPGTATPGDEFVSGSTICYFYPGGPDTSTAYVQLYGDDDPEGPETVLLSLADGGFAYNVGSPGAATLTIIDDDSDTATAYFELDDEIPQDPYGRAILAVEAGDEVAVDVVVEDLPPGGATIRYTSTADDQIHTFVFTDNPRQTIQVPTAEVPAGHAHGVNSLRILNPPDKQSPFIHNIVLLGVFFDAFGGQPQHCTSCFLAYLMILNFIIYCDDVPHCDLDCNAIFDPKKKQAAVGRTGRDIDAAADLETLARYRDEILTGSPAGDYYIQLYHDYSPAISVAILQRPALFHRVLAAWELWLPAVAAQVDGQGAAYPITVEMETALLGILTEFEEVGSPELADLVADFRVELDLENVAGTSAADLQQAIDDNPMQGERASWGEVKSFYGR